LGLEDVDHASRRAAVVALAQCPGDHPLDAASIALISATPSVLMEAPELLRLARTQMPELHAQWLATLLALPAYDAQRGFIEALDAVYAGDAAAMDRFPPLLESQQLSQVQLASIARIAEQQNRLDLAIASYTAMLNGGISRAATEAAQPQLVRLYLKSGQIEQALRSFYTMLPELSVPRREAEGHLLKLLPVDALPTVRAAAVQILKEHPEHPRNGHFAGFCSELFESFGTILDLDAMLVEAGVTGHRALQAQAYPALLEHWLVSRPMLCAPGELVSTLPPVLASFATEARRLAQPQQLHWRETSESQSLLGLDLKKTLGLANAPDRRCKSFALTELNSPDAREVELSLSWTGSLVLWLNGKCVYRANGGAAALPDRVRLRVSLNPGQNRLLAELRPEGTEWRLALGIANNGEGLTTTVPPPPAPPEQLTALLH